MRILVTGGAGFIGSNFVRWVVEGRKAHVITLDALTYAGNLANLEGLDPQWHTFVRGDVREAAALDAAIGEGVDAVVHFAAETHVDRSILDASAFFTTNVGGTTTVLDAVRRHQIARLVHVSTDEVYGTLTPGDAPFTEEHPLLPNSPYAASKAGSDLAVRAWVETYGLSASITRCGNNFGPYQFPEKLIPLFVTNALEGEALPLYGDGLQVRDWVYVEDHSRAVWRVLEAGQKGRVYNIGARNEQTNQTITRAVLRLTGRPDTLVRHVADRPGHDRRYAMDPTRIETELSWRPLWAFEDAMAATVDWYTSHDAWWRAVKSGAYRQYYAAQYGSRLS